MSDDFDRFLASSLAPADGEPDRQFVATVQARILFEERVIRQRRALLGTLAKQLLALFAVAAATSVITRAAPAASWFGESPAVALAVLLSAFALFLLLIAKPETELELASRL